MKKWTVLGMVGILAVTATGCGKSREEKLYDALNKNAEGLAAVSELFSADSTVGNSGADDAEQPKEQTAAEKAACQFISALQSEDYETAYSMVEMDKTFINTDAFGWYMARSAYRDIVGTDYEIMQTTSRPYDAGEYITVEAGPVSVSVEMELNNDNEWRVSKPYGIVENWEFAIPKNLTVTLDGVALTQEYLSAKEDGYDIYTIPAVLPREYTLVTTSTKYGNFENVVIPQNSEEPYEVVCELVGETRERIFEETRTMLNNINAVYDGGQSEATAYQNFVSEYAQSDFVTLLANSVLDEYTWNDILNPANIRWEVLKETDENNKLSCYVSANDTVTINARAEKSWVEKYDDENNVEGTKIYCSFVVDEMGTETKLVSMPTDNGITERNDSIMDWE